MYLEFFEYDNNSYSNNSLQVKYTNINFPILNPLIVNKVIEKGTDVKFLDISSNVDKKSNKEESDTFILNQLKFIFQNEPVNKHTQLKIERFINSQVLSLL